MENPEDVRVPAVESTESPASRRSKVLENPSYIAERRLQLKTEITRKREEVRAAAKALKEKRRGVALANNAKVRDAMATKPLTPDAEAKTLAKAEKRKLKKNARQRAYMRRYRAKKRAGDPEYQRKLRNKKQRQYMRRRKLRERHERWLKRLAAAAAKREAKAERRARREAIAEEKRRVAQAQGQMLPKSKRTRDLEAEYQRGFLAGFEEAKRLFEQTQHNNEAA